MVSLLHCASISRQLVQVQSEGPAHTYALVLTCRYHPPPPPPSRTTRSVHRSPASAAHLDTMRKWENFVWC